MFSVTNFNTTPPKRKYGEDGEMQEDKKLKPFNPNFAQSKLESLKGKENHLPEFDRAGQFYNKKFS